MAGVFSVSILMSFSYLPCRFIAGGNKVGNKNGWVRVERK
jgi:hypothetical protein